MELNENKDYYKYKLIMEDSFFVALLQENKCKNITLKLIG